MNTSVESALRNVRSSPRVERGLGWLRVGLGWVRVPFGWLRVGLGFLARHAALLIGLAWFGAAVAVTLWTWGLEPLVFPATDEAVNRSAAVAVRNTGLPFLKLPFPDPEDLAHMRLWLSFGERAIPTYPPVTYYVFGFLSRLGKAGFFLIAAIPASGAAAFAAGTAQLLPPARRWLALFAPILGFPALYWLLRPWMNVAVLSACLAWGFFFWGRWLRFGGTRWLTVALLSVGAAAAVRPDYAAFVLPIALLFSLAASPRQWRLISVLALAAGVCAVAPNLILNQVITGDPLRAVYQELLDREPANAELPAALRLLRQLVLPMGWPTASDANRFFLNYWINMGPLWLLVIGQLALVPLLLAHGRRRRALYAAGVLLVIVFVLARMDPMVVGAAEPRGFVNHSLPRYWAPIYLFAALPPILFLGRCRSRLVLALGSVGVFALAWFSVKEIHRDQRTSIVYIEQAVRNKTSWLGVVAQIVPADAIVYSENSDSWLWSRGQLGIIGSSPDATANSMQRAARAGLPVFIVQKRFARSDKGRHLERALRSRQLSMVQLNGRLGIYRVQPR